MKLLGQVAGYSGYLQLPLVRMSPISPRLVSEQAVNVPDEYPQDD
jgi:hypothetical protein